MRMKYYLIAVAHKCNKEQSRDETYYSVGHKIAVKEGVCEAKKEMREYTE